MKKVLIIVLSILIALPLITCGAGYGYIRYYYRDTYMPGLSVNNVYAADLTVEQLNDRLKQGMEIPEVVVTDKDGETHTFSMEAADYDENYTDDLKQIQESQTVQAFLKHLFDDTAKIQKRDVFPVITYDESKLDTFLDDQKFLKDDSKMAGKRIEIRESKTEGYFLYDETKNMLNHDKAKAVIEEAVSDGNYEVKLKESECYEKPSNLTPAQKYALRTWNKIKPYMETEIDRKSVV